MTTRTITADSLIDEYAETIADAAGLDVSDYDRTAAGLANLIRDAAADMGPMGQTGEWLGDAAVNLAAIALLGDDDAKTRDLLKRTDGLLYEATTDLA